MGNPPYQDDSGNKGKGHTLWTKFVELSLNKLLKINGYLLFIHPFLWRQIEHPLLKLMKSRQILYLEIHNYDDGQKTFKYATRYDWYALQNKNCNKKSIIKDEEGKINKINLNEWQFIPNMNFNIIKNIIFNDNDKCNVNNYRSNYGADKKHVSINKDNQFKYPVIYSINKYNIPSLRYSNNNQNGHFKLSKFIFSNGVGYLYDYDGKYGLTQWAYFIYDYNFYKIKLIRFNIKAFEIKN